MIQKSFLKQIVVLLLVIQMPLLAQQNAFARVPVIKNSLSSRQSGSIFSFFKQLCRSPLASYKKQPVATVVALTVVGIGCWYALPKLKNYWFGAKQQNLQDNNNEEKNNERTPQEEHNKKNTLEEPVINSLEDFCSLIKQYAQPTQQTIDSLSKDSKDLLCEVQHNIKGKQNTLYDFWSAQNQDSKGQMEEKMLKDALTALALGMSSLGGLEKKVETKITTANLSLQQLLTSGKKQEDGTDKQKLDKLGIPDALVELAENKDFVYIYGYGTGEYPLDGIEATKEEKLQQAESVLKQYADNDEKDGNAARWLANLYIYTPYFNKDFKEIKTYFTKAMEKQVGCALNDFIDWVLEENNKNGIIAPNEFASYYKKLENFPQLLANLASLDKSAESQKIAIQYLQKDKETAKQYLFTDADNKTRPRQTRKSVNKI